MRLEGTTGGHRDHLGLAAQSRVQMTFAYPQGERPHKPLSCCPVIQIAKKKKHFLMFRRKLLCLDIHPLPLVLKNPASVLFTSSLQVVIYIGNILSHLFSRLQSQLETFPLKERCLSPLIIAMALCWTLPIMPMSLLCWGPPD